MTEFDEIIKTRRSIRHYTNKEVEEEKIEKILKAGMQAPGSRLKEEPWEFLVIRDKNILGQLGEVKPRVANCNVAIVLLANMERNHYKEVWQQDMSAAAENMLLEACNQDIGGLWNGVAPIPERMQKISEILELPGHINVFCILSFGYPDGEENHYMDKFDQKRIHYEKYNK